MDHTMEDCPIDGCAGCMGEPVDACGHLRSLLWQLVDAHRIPAKRPDGEDRLLLNVDPDLWREAADAVGYDEMGQ